MSYDLETFVNPPCGSHLPVHSAYRADNGEQSSPRHAGTRLFLTRDRGIFSGSEAASLRHRAQNSAIKNPGPIWLGPVWLDPVWLYLIWLGPVWLDALRPLTAAFDNRIVERTSHLSC